jgi:fatty acid desaturase
MADVAEAAADPRSIQALFTREEWRDLSRVRPWPIVLAAAGTWGCIAGSFVLWAWTPNLFTFLCAFVVIATRQHALNNLVHEAAHYSITRRKALNDWISDALFAAPHFISTEGYRQKHQLHHSELGDPVLDTERMPRSLIRGAGFLRQTALALCGAQAFRAARAYAPIGGAGRPHWRHYLLVPVTNGTLFAFCWWLGSPLAYFYLWLLPLFTLTMYIGSLRVLAEHQSDDYAAAGVEDFDRTLPAFTRSIPAGAVERFVFGPVNFCYHHEHHLAPGIPFSSLPRLHAMLKARGFYGSRDERLGETYVGTLFRLVFPRAEQPLPHAADRA